MTVKMKSTIQRLQEDGKAVLEIETFNKRESKIIKDAVAAGIQIEIVRTYEARNNTYVEFKAV